MPALRKTVVYLGLTLALFSQEALLYSLMQMKAMSLLVLHILTEKNQAESHLVVKINLSRRISQRKVGHITVIFLARELYKIKKTLKLLQLLVFRQRQKWEMRMDLMLRSVYSTRLRPQMKAKSLRL
jgi:hypothetical protein